MLLYRIKTGSNLKGAPVTLIILPHWSTSTILYQTHRITSLVRTNNVATAH